MSEPSPWRELAREWRTNPALRNGTLFLALTLLGVIAVTYVVVQNDREQLVQRFEREREVQLRDVATLVESEFEDIHDDLELTARLAYNVYPEQQEAIVTALLGAVRAYRAAAVVDAEGHVKVISDPRRDEELSPAALTAIAAAGKQAMSVGTYISPKVGTGEDAWYRAFSQVGPTGEGAFVLLVDTRTFLDNLRVLSADPQTLVIVVGPQGQFAPTTSERIVAAFDSEEAPPELRTLVDRMRQTPEGSYKIPWKLATWTDFDQGDVVVAYRQVNAMPGANWSVATLTSLSVIRTAELALTTRLFAFVGFVTALLFGFAVYLLITTRRTAVLRERLASASELAHLHQRPTPCCRRCRLRCVLWARGRVTDANAAWALRWSHLKVRAMLEEQTDDQALSEMIRAAVDGQASGISSRKTCCLATKGVFTCTWCLSSVQRTTSARWWWSRISRPHDAWRRSCCAPKNYRRSACWPRASRTKSAHRSGSCVDARSTSSKKTDDPSSQRGLTVIIEQIDRVSRIIQELLDFSRVDAAPTRRVSLRDVVTKVAELLRVELDAAGVTLNVAIPDDLPELAADVDRLEQVLVNLVVNARDALVDRPNAAISIEAERREKEVLVTVSDNGSGIEPDALYRIFDPFFSTKKRGQGTGLGLAVVSQIIRNHGGRVDVSSEPGVGTRFVMTWPLFAARERQNEA
ncbi:MAG: ATP-binding protein [bacterium]